MLCLFRRRNSDGEWRPVVADKKRNQDWQVQKGPSCPSHPSYDSSFIAVAAEQSFASHGPPFTFEVSWEGLYFQ
jgi:hypothetical protein